MTFMVSASKAEFRSALDRVVAKHPITAPKYDDVMREVIAEREKWGKTLFSPRGLKMLFGRDI